MKTRFLVGVSLLVVTGTAFPQDPPTILPPNVAPPVDFRFVVVTRKAAGGERLALADVRLKDLGGRRFLVGVEVRPTDDRPGGRVPTWVAMDEVAVLREYADATAARDAAGIKTQTDKPPGGPGSDVMDWEGLTMKIPIDYHPDRRHQIGTLRLLVSADRGTTWTQHTECSTDRSHFDFIAPTDGEYWFCMQIVNKYGGKEPADGSFAAALKVRMKAPSVPRPRMEKARD